MITTFTGMKMSKYAKPFNTTFFEYNPFFNVNNNFGGGDGMSSNCDGDSDITEIPDEIFKKNPNGYNIKNACNWLQRNSQKGSCHCCARFVRMAIEKGFNDPNSTNGRPTWAWKYINYLPKIGFKLILHHIKDQTNYTPEPGDIAVYKCGGRTDVPGHICMWTGIQWCSDFKQKNMYVYSSTREADIFRFVE
jgi:hypothetical protein